MLHPFAPRDQFNLFPFARFGGGGGGYRNRPVAYIRKRGRILQFFPEWEDDTHSRRSKTLAALPLTLAPPRAFAQGYIQINPHIRRETCGMIQSTNIAAEGAPVSFRLRFCPKKFPHFPGCLPTTAPPPPPTHGTIPLQTGTAWRVRGRKGNEKREGGSTMLALPLPSHPTLFPFYATLMCFLSQAPSELEREGERGGMAALLPELGEGIVNFLFSPFRHGERGGGILLLQSMAAEGGGGLLQLR